MSMWDAIAYVSTGISLVAFLAAVASWTYRHKIGQKERLLRSLPENKRANAVADVLELFKVETSNLTKQQQYDLAIEQIRAKTKRYLLAIITVIIICFIGAFISFYAITQLSSPTLPITSQGTDLPDSLLPSSIALNTKCEGAKVIWLFDYHGSKKEGLDLAFEQFKGILHDKVNVLIETFIERSKEFEDIQDLHICLTGATLTSRKAAYNFLNTEPHSLEIATGTLFMQDAAPIARSRLYVMKNSKMLSFDAANNISANEFNAIRDEFSIITLYALALDAKRSKASASVIGAYLSDAYMLSKDLNNSELQQLLREDLATLERSLEGSG